jgi:hypothetical protein
MNDEDPIQQKLIDRIIKIIDYNLELWKASKYLWILQLLFDIAIIAIIFLTRR